MINSSEIYEDAGRKAGRAARLRDYRLAHEWNDWLARAVMLEQGDDKARARRLYENAYRDEATPRPQY